MCHQTTIIAGAGCSAFGCGIDLRRNDLPWSPGSRASTGCLTSRSALSVGRVDVESVTPSDGRPGCAVASALSPFGAFRPRRNINLSRQAKVIEGQCFEHLIEFVYGAGPGVFIILAPGATILSVCLLAVLLDSCRFAAALSPC